MKTFRGHGSSEMTIDQLSCVLHMPNARHQKFDESGDEIEQGLPEYAPQVAYNVDDYPGSQEDWMRGSAMTASYFVAVEPEKGLWLDFNRNQSGNMYHVAALISIQGVNPLIGQPTDGIRLEQYRISCPVHDQPFGAQRFCSDCNFKWPGQNYLASNAAPQGLFWLDGFRASDGRVRQYVFTLETMRGVAAQIIGNKRVYAIGVSFFLSKTPKPARPAPFSIPWNDSLEKGGEDDYTYRSFDLLGSSPMRGALRTRGTARESVAAQHIEVAAGARIDQKIYDDPEAMDFWQDKPAGTIYINYTDADTRDHILAAGRDSHDNRGEGWLGGLRVGN